MLLPRILTACRVLFGETTRFGFVAILASALLFPGTSCARRTNLVREVPNLRPVTDDPAVSGRGLKTSIEVPSRNPKDKSELSNLVQWSPIPEFDLNPNESHSLAFAIQEPATVFLRVLWSGGAGPVSALVTKGTVTIATGEVYPQPQDQGSVIAYGSVKSAGDVSVLVRNTGKRPVKVQAIWGVLLEEKP